MLRKFSVLAVIAVFLIVACATTIDHKISYLTARDTFNGALKNYSLQVGGMPAGAEKDAIKKDFNPVWKDADGALDTWGAIVKAGATGDPMEAIRLYTEAKNKIIQLGMKYFGDKIFEE